jgi:hypothetical protein
MEEKKGHDHSIDLLTRVFLAGTLIQFIGVAAASAVFFDHSATWLARGRGILPPISVIAIWAGSFVSHFGAFLIIPVAGLIGAEIFMRKPVQKLILYIFVIIITALCEFILLTAGFPTIYFKL